jgi:large subunit ribosomal protein L15
MVRERTKKQRGGRYGRGFKSGRGKGKRGGSGLAGLGKHRTQLVIKYDKNHFGVHGFKSHTQGNIEIPITLKELAESLEILRTKGYVSDNKGELVVDLKGAGYTKLLSTGEFKIKSKIIVPKTTERCINKLMVTGVLVEVDEQKDRAE